MSWINSPKKVPKDKVGFVYCITELSTGMRYYGIKKFWKRKSLRPLKNKVNKRHKIVENNWRDYSSSNKILQNKIKKNSDNYEKRIVILCDSLTDMKVYEAYIQLGYYISGNWDLLFNEMINLRLRIQKGEKRVKRN